MFVSTYENYIKEIFLIIFLSLMIGSLLLKIINFQNTKIYTNTFLSCLGGILFITITQAIIQTKFNTVLLIAPILLLMGYYINQKESAKAKLLYLVEPKKTDLATKLLFLGEMLIFVIAMYSIQYFLLFENGNPHAIRSASQDLTFYARCADYMNVVGSEGCGNDYFFPVSNKPYHYADVWLGSVISTISQANTLLSVVLTFKVIYFLIIYLGLMAILEQKYIIDFKMKIVCILTLFFTPLNLSAYENIRILSDLSVFSQTLYHAQKLFFIEALLLAAILLNLIDYKKLAVTVILCIPIFYTVTIVPVFSAFALYIMYCYIALKKVPYDELVLGSISGLFILIFYLVINAPGNDVSPIEMHLSEMINYKHTLNIIGGTLIQHIVLYFPVCILSVVHLKDQNLIGNAVNAIVQSPIYIIIIFMPIFGLLLWSITSGNSNSVQLFQNIAMPIFYTASIIFVIATFMKCKLHFRGLIFLLLLINAVNQVKTINKIPASYNPIFFEKIMRNVKLKNNIYVTYKPNSWYKNIFFYMEKGLNFGNYIAYFKNGTQPVSLDIIETSIEGDLKLTQAANVAIKSSTMYQYILEKKQKGIYKTVAEYQIDFIQEKNIELLITQKFVKLPDHLERLVVERIEDDFSGEVVCILRS